MFEDTPTPRLFALPPGVDFPKVLVDGLFARLGDAPPEALSRVTIYVNTRRMQRRIRDILAARGALLLPRLRLVTDPGTAPIPGLPPAEPALRRRLELARLVAALLDREPGFAPGARAFDLAQSLGALLAEMQDEGVGIAALDRPELAEGHGAHWERSLHFIRIVARYMGPDVAPDPAARQRLAVQRLAADWAAKPPEHPVIVAGSTGSRGTTALLIGAVARLPQGAVVLPGFDFELPDRVWHTLDAGPFPGEDHPQYRFRRLLTELQMAPGDVRRWAADRPPSAARNRLVSLALRPAPVTDQWLNEGPDLPDLSEVTAELSLIEAPDPRAEAAAIALALREAAEAGTRAALVTPDRLLARRVQAALDRWGIIADDSAGEPLSASPPGRFLRQVAGLCAGRAGAEYLLALLKHPLTASAEDSRGPHLLLTRVLELHLRRRGIARPDAAAIRDWAEGGDAATKLWAEWLVPHLDAAPGADEPLATQVSRHLGWAETLAAGPVGGPHQLWQAAAGEAARKVMDELLAEAAHGGAMAGEAYADLLTTLLQEVSVRRPEITHPGVAIWGTLEARVQGADLLVLGGLNERTWPAMPAPDPWLSRGMRQRAGLLLPERRIGLAAHDFAQGAAAPRVILSRALRDAEAATLPSRWLNRLGNLLNGLGGNHGPDAWAAMRARGARYLALAHALDDPRGLPAPLPPALRPSPRPPIAVRPRQLSVTEIQTLIRDPYAIYARHVLGLRKLDPLRPEPDARLRGTALHGVMEDFTRNWPAGATAHEAAARLLAMAELRLRRDIPWAAARRLWLLRLAGIADALADAEATRRAQASPILIEEKHRILIDPPGFTLTAKPDRIDLLADGSAHIYDYKSGAPPSPGQQKQYDKQMLLQAAMAEAGAFAPLGARRVQGASYIRLGGKGEEKAAELTPELIAETWAGLQSLMARYLGATQGYTARRAMMKEADASDYDHLSRFGEWELSTKPSGEDVGC